MISNGRSNRSVGILYKRPFKVLVCLVTLWSFLFSTISCDLAWAARTPLEPTAVGSNRAGSPGFSQKNIDIDKVDVPFRLGEIRESFLGSNGKTIIHIQDAHCNYSCQRSTKELISYLNSEYGINLAALEGGAGNYDLSIFTSIKDKVVREKVADYFVKEGRINGTEFFAINNPDKITLKGLEEPSLYIENLKVYRESLKYKDDVDKILKILTYYLANLKNHVYSEQLKNFEEVRQSYNDKKMEFNEYLKYLFKVSKELDIKSNAYKNLYKLIEVIEQEKDVDFKKANSERESLIDELAKKLSKIEIETLVKKAVQFKEGSINQPQFYTYLFRKIRTIDIDINAKYPNLARYKKYVDTYESIENVTLFNEMESLENDIATMLFKNESQKELYQLSKNLILIKDLFGISLTRDRYDYYQKNRPSLDVKYFISFIAREASKYKIETNLSDDIKTLDIYRDKMDKFYELAFKRDTAFMGNISKYTNENNVLVIVTGGFHTDSLKQLLKEKGYSFITIMPKLDGNAACPYFNVLSGGMSSFEKSISTALSLIQVPSFLNELGIKASDPRLIELFRIQAIALQSMYGNKAPVGFRLNDGRYAIFDENNGNPVCYVKDEPGNAKIIAENITKGNANSIMAAFSEIGQDRIIREAEKRIYLRKDDPIIAETIKVLDSIPDSREKELLIATLTDLLKRKSYIDESGKTQSPKGYSAIQMVEGLTASHPGGQGIYLAKTDKRGSDLTEKEQSFILIHELIAGLYAGSKSDGLDSHSLAEAVINSIVANNTKEAMRLLATADPYHKPLWEMTASERQNIERDYSGVADKEKAGLANTIMALFKKVSIWWMKIRIKAFLWYRFKEFQYRNFKSDYNRAVDAMAKAGMDTLGIMRVLANMPRRQYYQNMSIDQEISWKLNTFKDLLEAGIDIRRIEKLLFATIPTKDSSSHYASSIADQMVRMAKARFVNELVLCGMNKGRAENLLFDQILLTCYDSYEAAKGIVKISKDKLVDELVAMNVRQKVAEKLLLYEIPLSRNYGSENCYQIARIAIQMAKAGVPLAQVKEMLLETIPRHNGYREDRIKTAEAMGKLAETGFMRQLINAGISESVANNLFYNVLPKWISIRRNYGRQGEDHEAIANMIVKIAEEHIMQQFVSAGMLQPRAEEILFTKLLIEDGLNAYPLAKAALTIAIAGGTGSNIENFLERVSRRTNGIRIAQNIAKRAESGFVNQLASAGIPTEEARRILYEVIPRGVGTSDVADEENAAEAVITIANHRVIPRMIALGLSQDKAEQLMFASIIPIYGANAYIVGEAIIKFLETGIQIDKIISILDAVKSRYHQDAHKVVVSAQNMIEAGIDMDRIEQLLLRKIPSARSYYDFARDEPAEAAGEMAKAGIGIETIEKVLLEEIPERYDYYGDGSDVAREVSNIVKTGIIQKLISLGIPKERAVKTLFETMYEYIDTFYVDSGVRKKRAELYRNYVEAIPQTAEAMRQAGIGIERIEELLFNGIPLRTRTDGKGGRDVRTAAQVRKIAEENLMGQLTAAGVSREKSEDLLFKQIPIKFNEHAFDVAEGLLRMAQAGVGIDKIEKLLLEEIPQKHKKHAYKVVSSAGRMAAVGIDIERAQRLLLETLPQKYRGYSDKSAKAANVAGGMATFGFSIDRIEQMLLQRIPSKHPDWPYIIVDQIDRILENHLVERLIVRGVPQNTATQMLIEEIPLFYANSYSFSVALATTEMVETGIAIDRAKRLVLEDLPRVYKEPSSGNTVTRQLVVQAAAEMAKAGIGIEDIEQLLLREIPKGTEDDYNGAVAAGRLAKAGLDKNSIKQLFENYKPYSGSLANFRKLEEAAQALAKAEIDMPTVKSLLLDKRFIASSVRGDASITLDKVLDGVARQLMLIAETRKYGCTIETILRLTGFFAAHEENLVDAVRTIFSKGMGQPLNTLPQDLASISREINGGFNPDNPAHLLFNYMDILEQGRHYGLSNRFSFENYLDIVRNRSDSDDYLSGGLGIQLRGLVYEASLMMDKILEIQERAKKLGLPVLVVENLTYGAVALAPITEERNGEKYIMGTDIRVISTKIGSTEHHYDPDDDRCHQARNDYSNIFTDSELAYIVRHRPIILTIDGSTSVSDSTRTNSHIPDSYKGWRNIFMAINFALSGRTDSIDPVRDKYSIYKEIIAENGSLQRIIARVKEIVNAIPAQERKSGDYSLGFWYPGKKDLWLRRNHTEPKKVVSKIDASEIKGPELIFMQSAMETDAVPSDIKDRFVKGEHSAAFFDDDPHNHFGQFYVNYEEGYGAIFTHRFISTSRGYYRELRDMIGKPIPEAPRKPVQDVIKIDTIVADLDGVLAHGDEPLSFSVAGHLDRAIAGQKALIILTDDLERNVDERVVRRLSEQSRRKVLVFSDGATLGYGFRPDGTKFYLDSYNESTKISPELQERIMSILNANFSNQFDIDTREARISPGRRVDLRNLKMDRNDFIAKAEDLLNAAGIKAKLYKVGKTSVKIVLKHKEDALAYCIETFGVKEESALIIGDSARTNQNDRKLLTSFKNAVSVNLGQRAKTINRENPSIVQLAEEGVNGAIRLLSYVNTYGGLPVNLNGVRQHRTESKPKKPKGHGERGYAAVHENVSCGTICEAEHEGSYEALDEQLKRQFNEFKRVLGIVEMRDLTEAEADNALVKLGYAKSIQELQDLRTRIRKEVKMSDGIKIFFSVPSGGTELFWVGDDYGAGHYNKAGTRMHISLPFLYKRSIGSGVEIAGHELAHIQGKGHLPISDTLDSLLTKAVESDRVIQHSIEPFYIKSTGMEMLRALQDAPIMNQPCTIGMVVRAKPGDNVDLLLQEKFTLEAEILGRRLGKKIQINKGIIEYEVDKIKYVAYVDDGTDSAENLSRIEKYKERLLAQGNPKERTFAWVLSNENRLKSKSCLDSLHDIAYLAGLNGEYLPVSWQMLSGPLFANLIASKSKPGTNEEERINAIIDAIISSISQMTKTELKEWDSLRAELKTISMDDLNKKFNGISFILHLPPIVPVSDALEKCRKADMEVRQAA